jgi:hypothetical protein
VIGPKVLCLGALRSLAAKLSRPQVCAMIGKIDEVVREGCGCARPAGPRCEATVEMLGREATR